MRLKIQLSPSAHSEAITGVDWLNSDEAISASDDHGIWRWSWPMGKLEATPLPNHNKEAAIFPASLQLVGRSSNDFSRHQNRSKRSTINSPNSSGANDLILLSAFDGKIHLVNLSGKLEKSIEAHKGATILARWSNAEPGGAGGFASCGEDGCVKIWSRNGMLRSVLAQLGKPVYALDWNGGSTKLAYCAGEECFIKQLNVQKSPIKWRAHGGIVLCLSWSVINDQIVTGGEDCLYRLWDGQGHPLWSSHSHGFPITSLAWSPNGEMFAVGTFNLLRLCDKSGWSHSLERPNCGSIYCLSWSSDATQLVGGCANGQLLHAHIVEKRLMWEQLEAVQTRRKMINIRDLSSEVARERLETRDRVIRMELGFNFLVVATTKQCYIFSAKNWNTPIVTDLKEGPGGMVTLVRLCEKSFLLVDSSSAQVWNYEGRILSTIRLPSAGNVGGDAYNEQTAAIATDLVVLRDRTQHTLVHLFDPQTGRTAGDGEMKHNSNIVELCVNQCGGIADRRVAFVDANGDCFLALVHCYGAAQRTVKIGSLISCLSPNNSTNMLAAFQDGQRLIIWALPTVAFVDRDLLPATQIELANSAEMGKSSAVLCFISNTVTVRQSDGSLIAHYVPPFVAALIRCAQQGHWDQAVRICRAIKEDFLWATLAGLAVSGKNFTIAEISYGRLREAEKVLFLASLRAQPNPQMRASQIFQFGGQARESESALVKSGRYFRAIILNLGVFRFDKALELAMKSGAHLDTVLGYRQRYLDLLGRKENDPKFLKHLSQVEIDWPHIFEKMREDEEKDQRQWGGGGGGGLESPN